jgi:hypothetical protein
MNPAGGSRHEGQHLLRVGILLFLAAVSLIASSLLIVWGLRAPATKVEVE